jgi:hypothetical protein
MAGVGSIGPTPQRACADGANTLDGLKMWKLIRKHFSAGRIIPIRAAAAPQPNEARTMRYRRSDTDGSQRRMREVVEKNRLL